MRGPQHVFVNRRIVRDRTIAHAIIDAYSTATIKERSPEVHLFFELAPERVDVNVHPTKAEVRFLEPSLVHEVLRRALADTLGRPEVPELQLRGRRRSAPRRSAAAGALPIPGRLRRDAADRSRSAAPTIGGVPRGHAPVGGWAGAVGALLARGERNADAGVDRQTAIDAVMPMVPLGQFRDTYIIAIDAEGLLIIDQHVAHERILFEQVLERLTAGHAREPAAARADGARPVSRRSARRSRCTRAELARLGFEVEEFGGATVRVAAVPALVPIDRAAAAIRALAEDLEGLERGASVEEALRRIGRDDGVSRGGEGARSADAREDAVHPRTSCAAPPIRRSARTAARSCCASASARSRRISSGFRRGYPRAEARASYDDTQRTGAGLQPRARSASLERRAEADVEAAAFAADGVIEAEALEADAGAVGRLQLREREASRSGATWPASTNPTICSLRRSCQRYSALMTTAC